MSWNDHEDKWADRVLNPVSPRKATERPSVPPPALGAPYPLTAIAEALLVHAGAAFSAGEDDIAARLRAMAQELRDQNQDVWEFRVTR